MSGIDGWLEGIMHGQVGVVVILLVSLLLGLRHASDPDHLAAVTTLIASE
jgi:high-affinity nickel permease